MHKIEGLSQLDAMLKALPDFEVIRLVNLSRDPGQQMREYGNKLLLDSTLKATCDLTEIEYQIAVLKKRDFKLDELVEVYQKATLTL